LHGIGRQNRGRRALHTRRPNCERWDRPGFGCRGVKLLAKRLRLAWSSGSRASHGPGCRRACHEDGRGCRGGFPRNCEVQPAGSLVLAMKRGVMVNRLEQRRLELPSGIEDAKASAAEAGGPVGAHMRERRHQVAAPTPPTRRAAAAGRYCRSSPSGEDWSSVRRRSAAANPPDRRCPRNRSIGG